MNTEMRQILSKVPEDKKGIAGRIADELVFMQETLSGLREQIAETGAVEHFKQGKQEFDRVSPAMSTYNSTLKQYSTLMKQLTDLLPKEEPIQKANAVYEFLKESE